MKSCCRICENLVHNDVFSSHSIICKDFTELKVDIEKISHKLLQIVEKACDLKNKLTKNMGIERYFLFYSKFISFYQ